MKNLLKILAISLMPIVVLAGCAAPMQKVTTSFYEDGKPYKIIETSGNVYSDQLERLQHAVILGRVPGERTRIDINTGSRGGRHSSDVLRRVKKLEDKILGR